MGLGPQTTKKKFLKYFFKSIIYKMPITPLDADGMAKLRAMRGKGKKSKKGSSGKKAKKGKKDSEGKEKKALVKEHVKLVSVLKGAKPKALKAELKMQTTELKDLKKK